MSDTVTYRLIMDFTHPLKAQIINLAKDDTNSVKVRCILQNSGEAFDMSEIVTAYIYAVNANNNVVYQEATILTEEVDGEDVNTNVLEYTFPANITGYAGAVTCYFVLTKENYQLSTPKFYLDIGAQLFDPNEYVSSDSVADIQALITRERSLVTQIESSVSSGIKNPYALSVAVTGGTGVTYDGSVAKTLTLTKAAQMSVANNLTEAAAGKLLDAYQGKLLKDAVDANGTSITTINGNIDTINSSINNLKTYSTSERAVGTWINGSTVYEKTFTTTVRSFAHGISFSKVIAIDATYSTGSNSPYGYVSCAHEVAVQGTNIYLMGTVAERVANGVNITIRYIR